MNLALHQPYFFPYIGYFSVLNGVDIFVHGDTMQYMKQGWVNRNRILVAEGEWRYIIVPVKKFRTNDKITEIEIDYSQNWEKKMLAQMSYYKKYAPYYKDVIELVEAVLSKKYSNLAELNIEATNVVLDYMQIEKSIYRLSDISLEFNKKPEADEWGILVSKAFEEVDCYWNAPGGQTFYDKQKYSNADLDIKFVKTELEKYKQGRADEFVEGLSIIDVMMFNSTEEIREMLEKYKLV